ncbi:MAG: LysR family transcriptional regulator [Alphaproteobacteria bacterium]|nr:LysR family transcriptional regulator [Alphaproteobacteria bacterium]
MTKDGKGSFPKSASGRPKMDWDDIRVFNAVYEAHSISGAARILGVTPSMVSKRLDLLEARLQSKLFERGAKGVTLTHAGQEVLEYAQTMARAAESIERVAGAQDKRRQGSVLVAAPDGLATFWLTQKLEGFHEQNPSIQVKIDCGMWPHNAFPETPDILLAFKDEHRPDMVIAPLATYHYMLWASQGYLRKHGAPKTLPELSHHRFIHLRAFTHQRASWDDRAQSIAAVAEIGVESNSSAVHIYAASAGAGIAAAPTWIKPYAPPLELAWQEPLAKVRLSMVYRRDAMKSARVRAVGDWLRAIFEPRDYPWFREEFIHPDQFDRRLTPGKA